MGKHHALRLIRRDAPDVILLEREVQLTRLQTIDELGPLAENLLREPAGGRAKWER